MFSYIARRVFATIPVMMIVALFVFSLLYIAPGDPAAVIAGDQASPEDVEKIRSDFEIKGVQRKNFKGTVETIPFTMAKNIPLN